MGKSGLYYEEGESIKIGDKVLFLGLYVGNIVFECGSFGIGIDSGIDYEKIQSFMDADKNCCGNRYSGCNNDNYISLWEVYWNFNCDEESIHVIEKIGEQ